MISEINAEPTAAQGGSKKILLIAVIGGAAVGGLAAALGHGKSSSPSVGTISTPPPTVLVPGTPTIQPPH